jgi:hypothetical protein
LADGSVNEVSPTQNRDIFYAAMGSYGGICVVAEVELQLAENIRVQRLAKKMSRYEYIEHFKAKVLRSTQYRLLLCFRANA